MSMILRGFIDSVVAIGVDNYIYGKIEKCGYLRNEECVIRILRLHY